MKTKIIIDGVDYTKYCTMPIQEQDTADESLGSGYLELFGTNKSEPFKPFSKLQIQKDDGSTICTENYFIASDECREDTKNNKFSHDIVLIEETKELERYMVDNKTITNPVVHDYLSNKHKVMVSGTTTEFWFFPSSKYIELSIYSPQEKDATINIPRPYHMLMEYFRKTNYTFISTVGTDFSNVDLTITAPDGSQAGYYNDSCSSAPANETFVFVPTQIGEYTFTFVGHGNLGGIGNVTASFIVVVLNANSNKADWTIQDVCNALLQTSDCLRVSETPKFALASVSDYPQNMQSTIANLFSQKSPEFTFTKCTLFEALKEVGDFIHAIPRLKQNKIYFDLLGTDEETSANLQKYYSCSQTQNIDNFCSELDMSIENLIDADDDNGGSITEPFVNGYKTLRTENGTAQITEDGIIIATEYPIYDIIKLEAGVLSNGTPIGDITPFVYENAEYQTLSSGSDTFPTSKMYALKFTQGEKNITELNFKNEHLISNAFENYSIMNIIYKKINLSTNWWSNFWNDEDLYKLQFKVTYIPIVSARIKQTKTNIKDLAFRNVLSYNQSSHMVSAKALGENLRGAVAKYGVPEKKIMFTVSKQADIPKVNTKFMGYTITSVKTETYNNHILVEVGMSKKFNNKSAYLTINSQKRYYEVSEKHSQNRQVLYEDYCIIGDAEESDEKSLITDFGIDAFKDSFETGLLNTVGVAKTQGVTKEDVDLTEIVKPIIALGVGNSVLFAFAFDDNYSAGNTASYSGATRIQDYVQYADIWGEIDKLNVKFCKVKDIEYSYNLATTTGDAYPLGTALPSGHFDVLFNTNDDAIKLCKDNREQISFSYQMHFISSGNRQNIVIGSGIGSKNTFASNKNLNYKLYILPNKINEFNGNIDLTNATEISLSMSKINSHQIKIDDIVASANGKSWALVNVGTTNELICGENTNIIEGNNISLPYFTFTRNIRSN